MYNLFDKFPDEHSSKVWFINILKSLNFTNIVDTDEINKFCYFDIFAKDSLDKSYMFELKVRYTTPSLFTYGDGSILKDKYDKFKLKSNQVDKQILVSMFSDGFAFANLKNEPYMIRKALTTETTAFESHKAVYRDFCHFKHDFIFHYPTDK